MSESHLAEAAGLQLKHVTELESGQLELTNSRDLVKIARALDVPLAELTGEVPAFRKNLAAHQVAFSIREILLERDFLSLLRDGTVELSSVYLEEFAERLEEVWGFVHRSDYTAVQDLLANLLRETDDHARRSGADAIAFAQLSDVYQAASAVISSVGETDLTWVCGDRAVFAAENAGDRLRVGASLFRLEHVFIRSGHFEDEVRVAAGDKSLLESSDGSTNISSATIEGSLALVRAIGNARLGLRSLAEEDLQTA